MNTIEKPSNEVDEKLRALLDGKENYFPTLLCANYPQIADKICSLWRDPKLLHHYFTDLMTTDRANRVGFPPDIHREIFTLSNYYLTLHPRAQLGDDFWSGVDTRLSTIIFLN